MYESHFGLEKSPFSMTSDPNCLFMTEQHREAIAGLVYAIRSRKGLLVLSGEVGTGKTTVLARVVKHLPRTTVQVAVILHPTLTPDEFLEMVMLDLGIEDIPASKAQRLHKLQYFLVNCRAENKVAALIVDEAHKLSPEVLEEIRLLGNLDAADQKLLQVVLVGQSELDEMLRREDLRQLKQRVALRVSLKALSKAEVHDYISYRWRQAGARQPIPFSSDAVAQIIHWSNGVPRLINSLCDQSLLVAFGNGSKVVQPEYVMEAARDLDLSRPASRVMAALESAVPAAAPVAASAVPASPVAASAAPASPNGVATGHHNHVPAPVSKPVAAPGTVGNGAGSKAAVLDPQPLAQPPQPAPSVEASLTMLGGIRAPEFGTYAQPKRSLLSRCAALFGFHTN